MTRRASRGWPRKSPATPTCTTTPRPEISDAAFDALWDELKQLAPNHPQLQRVGAEIEPGSVKVDHRFPMRSLDKGTEDADLVHFVQQTAGGATRILAQPKLDGSALSLNTAADGLCARPRAAAATAAKT